MSFWNSHQLTVVQLKDVMAAQECCGMLMSTFPETFLAHISIKPPEMPTWSKENMMA